MIYQNLCPLCKAELQKVSDTKYACAYCLNTYSSEKIEDYNEKLSKLFDNAKLELFLDAEQNLYSAISADYISKNEVIRWCDEVKKYLPDDFQANFYYALAKESKREVAKMLREIDVDKHSYCLERLINVVIKSLEKSYVAPMKNLIERAYKLKNIMDKYAEYTEAIEDEAENLDKYIYDPIVPRDAFIAYSNKDSKKAIELVEYLESQGISCFISQRNLRHGVGSKERYELYLNKAMESCMCFVFVSSMNSRDNDCDAYKIEIPYIMKKIDEKNAPGNFRNFYTKIPYEYKKPRVEYRIEESLTENVADILVDNFFSGYERVYTLKNVAIRINAQKLGVDESAFLSPTPTQPEVENKVKFCLECLTKCSFEAKFCQACGKTEFADTKKEAELIKKLNELQTQTDNAKANAEAKQAEVLALQKKNEDLQKENQKLQDEKKKLQEDEEKEWEKLCKYSSCKICGARDFEKVSNKKYMCTFCGTINTIDSLKKYWI